MCERVGEWINLNDPNGAMLKIMPYQEGSVFFLVVSGVVPRTALFNRLIKEAKFTPSNNGGLLVRRVQPGEEFSPRQFQPFWPDAKKELMKEEEYLLPDPTKIKPKANENESEHELRDRSEEHTSELQSLMRNS